MGRVVLPNYPHHVVQRGHDRQMIFACEVGFHRYLDDIRELKTAFDVRIHALLPADQTCAFAAHARRTGCRDAADVESA